MCDHRRVLQRWLAVAAAAIGAVAPARGAVRVVPRAIVAVTDRVAIGLVVTSAGDEAVRLIEPEVRFADERAGGKPAMRLEGGAAATWRFSFPRPAGTGELPPVVHIDYLDPDGVRRSAATMVPVALPGTPETRARVALPPYDLYLERFYLVRLRVENAGDRPLAGRLVTVAPDDIGAPGPTPIEVPAGDAAEVPLVFENRGGRPGAIATVAIGFEYALDTAPRLAVAEATFTLGGFPEPPADRRAVAIVAVLLAAVIVAAFALYTAAGRPWKRRRPVGRRGPAT